VRRPGGTLDRSNLSNLSNLVGIVMSRRSNPGLSASSSLSRSATFVVIWIALLFAGCGVNRSQTEAAGAFSRSAVALSVTVKTAYAQAPQDEADLRAARYVISDHDYEKAQSLGITGLKGRMAAASVLSAARLDPFSLKPSLMALK